MSESGFRRLVRGVLGGSLVIFLIVTTCPASMAQDHPVASATTASGETAPAQVPPALPTSPVIEMGLGEMFVQAHIVVKAVMVFLAFCSLLTWAIFLEKTILFARTRRANARFLMEFRQSAQTGTVHPADSTSAMGRMWLVARVEFDHFRSVHTAKPASHQEDRLLQRIALTVGIVQERELARLGAQMGILATIGSTSPFTGLFGTVWGILHSFAHIASSKSSNLAVVAPGIAEALLATAIGLFAAIPAVIIFNKFVRDTNGFLGALDNFSAELITAMSRQLDKVA